MSMFDMEAIKSSENVTLGKNLLIGENVKWVGEVVIGDNCIIEDNVIIGYDNLTRLREGYKKSPTIIGDNVHIRSGSVIYSGCILNERTHIGHNVLLREFTKIGDNTSIGSGCVCEGYTEIGHDVRIQAQCHLTSRMKIGNYVFMGALVSTMNDKKMRYARPEIEDSPDIGPVIGDGCAIGSSCIILPRVEVGFGSIIGAGTLVTKHLEPLGVYIGHPARYIRPVEYEEIPEFLRKDLKLTKSRYEEW